MILYIPVEVKNRELYSKVLLAKYAADKGFRVIIGKKNDLNKMVLRMPAGVYVGLGVPENYEAFYRQLNELGNIIVVCEEEGLITYTDDMYLDMRISPRTMQYVNTLFSWGRENRNLISSHMKELSHKIKVSGHPRFDLLKSEFSNVYKDEIEVIRNKYDRYVLICTCFSSCNHFLPEIDYVQSLIDKKVLRSPKAIANFRRYQKTKAKTFRSFLQAISLLAKACPSTNIVVRPHPSENETIYTKLSGEFNNVHVESNVFSVHPWILAAEALVHHYCATAVEAYAAGVPRFALRPEADPLSEKEIPFECSNVCSSPEELVAAVRSCVTDVGRDGYLATPEKDYSDYVLNIGNVVSAELLAAEIHSLVAQQLGRGNGGLKNSNRWYHEYIGRISLVLRDMHTVVQPRKNRWQNYTGHKFDGLSRSEIRRILVNLGAGEENEMACKRRGGKFIEISRENNRVNTKL